MKIKVIYTNENYEVSVAPESKGYSIRNTLTDVIEDNSPTLPHALAQAEQMNLILLQEEWKRYAAQMYPSSASNVINLETIDTDKVN